MMATLLLIIIYAAFISLGLPDSLLGSAWPEMYAQLQVPQSSAGILSMIISGGTILSSLLCERMIRRFGTAAITVVSVSMTAAALLGFSLSGHFGLLCLVAIPLGLGAGAIDSALNNFVALHYESRHMNWLHAFWGIGATCGPLIMSLFLGKEGGWRSGYGTISIIQWGLVAILVLSLPLWKPFGSPVSAAQTTQTGRQSVLKLPGVLPTLLSFFCYCAVEAMTGLWGSSFLVDNRQLSPETAAQWISLFYLGITTGRVFSGFLAISIANDRLIRLGELILLVGILLLLLPWQFCGMIGLILIGLGCAPIFPAMLHETPRRFGAAHSQSLMGLQMACAYLGTTCMPPLFGWLASHTGTGLLPVVLIVTAALMFLLSEKALRIFQHHEG